MSERANRRAALAVKLASTDPADMSLRNLLDYLGHHGVSQSGPRVLLNWRVHQLRAQLPVMRPNNAAIPWEPVARTAISRGNSGGGGLLHVPPDVLTQHVLPHLDGQTLMALLYVSRVFYAHCWRHISVCAQRFFALPGATPLALSCYYYYMRLVEERDRLSAREPATKKARAAGDQERTHKHAMARALHIPQAHFTETYVTHDRVKVYIRLSIHKHGSLDVLLQLPAYRAQQKLAMTAQQAFIASCVPQRMAAVNAVLQHQGLTALGGVPFSPDACCALQLVCGIDAFRIMQDKVDAYVHMKHSTNDPPALFHTTADARRLRALCLAMAAFAQHATRPAAAADAVHYALVPWLVIDPSVAVEELFCAEFLGTVWPNRGTLLCLCPPLERAQIVQMSEHSTYNRADLVAQLSHEEAKLGRRLQFAPLAATWSSENPPPLRSVWFTPSRMGHLLCAK